MNKKLLLILILTFAFVFGCTQAVLDDSSYKEPVYATFKVVNENGETVFYEQTDFEFGTNAFVATKEIFGSKLKYDEYDFGVFITEINGLSAKTGYFWELFVDGTAATTGISSYIIEKEIIFEWRLSEINFE